MSVISDRAPRAKEDEEGYEVIREGKQEDSPDAPYYKKPPKVNVVVHKPKAF